MQNQILELEDRILKLQAFKDEVQSAMTRQGLGLMRTSKGPSDTLICHDMETDARLHQKELALINENIYLKINLEKALALVNAVVCAEFSGVGCMDVNGKNWFDTRDELLNLIQAQKELDPY